MWRQGGVGIRAHLTWAIGTVYGRLLRTTLPTGDWQRRSGTSPLADAVVLPWLVQLSGTWVSLVSSAATGQHCARWDREGQLDGHVFLCPALDCPPAESPP